MKLRKLVLGVAFAGVLAGSSVVLAADEKPAPHKTEQKDEHKAKDAEHKDKAHHADDKKAPEGHEKKKQ